MATLATLLCALRRTASGKSIASASRDMDSNNSATSVSTRVNPDCLSRSMMGPGTQALGNPVPALRGHPRDKRAEMRLRSLIVMRVVRHSQKKRPPPVILSPFASLSMTANGLSRNSTHYSFPLSSLGRACLSRPRPATNPSPGPRRLKKAASRSTLSPWERADPLCHALRF